MRKEIDVRDYIHHLLSEIGMPECSDSILIDCPNVPLYGENYMALGGLCHFYGGELFKLIFPSNIFVTSDKEFEMACEHEVAHIVDVKRRLIKTKSVRELCEKIHDHDWWELCEELFGRASYSTPICDAPLFAKQLKPFATYEGKWPHFVTKTPLFVDGGAV